MLPKNSQLIKGFVPTTARIAKIIYTCGQVHFGQEMIFDILARRGDSDPQLFKAGGYFSFEMFDQRGGLGKNSFKLIRTSVPD